MLAHALQGITMAISFTKAANAYQNQLRMLEGQKPEAEGIGAPAGGPSFVSALEDAWKGTADTLHRAETVSAQSLTGKVELADLVTAVSSAELTLSTVVAIRDRVISAYQDILRMPI